MTFSPFDPDRQAIRRQRFRTIPVRILIPNLITLLALCAGLTAIRLAFEDKLEWALAAIVFAAALDGLDGRVARLIKGQSRFGAELDSLADFVNFGCTPALIVYLWGLHQAGNVGWIAAMVFAICGALRLARFNVMVDDPDRPLWAAHGPPGMRRRPRHCRRGRPRTPNVRRGSTDARFKASRSPTGSDQTCPAPPAYFRPPNGGTRPLSTRLFFRMRSARRRRAS